MKATLSQVQMAVILLCRALYGFRYGDRTIGGGRGKNNRIAGEEEVEVVVVVENNRIVVEVVENNRIVVMVEKIEYKGPYANTTATATRTSRNKRFNEQNNSCARAL